MIRSIDFPCDRRWIKNPTNSPLATQGARKGAAALTKLCIVTLHFMLDAHFKKPPAFYDRNGWTVPNKWTVTLTRISMGTLDPITGGASMKAIQDAVATWCGVKNERDPIWQWIEPIRQERRGFVKGSCGTRRGWSGVRIELEDLEPGEPRVVVLKEIERFIWLAKQRIKEAKVFNGVKKNGRVLSYQPEGAARGASSAARSKAEEVFGKLAPALSKADVDAYESELRGCGMRRGRDYERSGDSLTPPARPTALDLRDAAERVLKPQSTGKKCLAELSDREAMRAKPASRGAIPSRDPGEERPRRSVVDAVREAEDNIARLAAKHGVALPSTYRRMTDPGEERPARDLAPCTTCGVAIGQHCVPLSNVPTYYGVHMSRARAAGLVIDGVVQPPRAPTNGVRKPAAKVQTPAYARLPWTAKPCGRAPLTRWQAADGLTTAVVHVATPVEHVARFGGTVELHRHERETPKLGRHIVYE